jgi:dynein heavy chain
MNAALVDNCDRWPLLIDPQLQGIEWVKEREKDARLHVLTPDTDKYIDKIAFAVSQGEPVLLHGLGENIDAVLMPLISKSVTCRGRSRFVTIGDKEVDFDDSFRLYLHTSLPNPHYRPEIAAQTTLINFCVTEDGLEQQLLALVVNHERAELEHQRSELIVQQNDFKIKLKELEDDLLMRLSNAQGDILQDVQLIENLENTKKTATEVAEKQQIALATERDIDEARNFYKGVATRGSLLFFLLSQLSNMDHMYQYSLGAFVNIFLKALERASASDVPEERLRHMVQCVTYTVFTFVTRGLFERHRGIFTAQMCFQIHIQEGTVSVNEFEVFLKRPRAFSQENPVAEWLPDVAWECACGLTELEWAEKLPSDLEESARRWKEWYEREQPETVQLPGEWRSLDEFR